MVFDTVSTNVWGIGSPGVSHEMSVDDWGILSSVDPTQPQHNPLEFALTTTQTYTSVTQDLQLMPSSWPPNLPNPEVTRHLYVRLPILLPSQDS